MKYLVFPFFRGARLTFAVAVQAMSDDGVVTRLRAIDKYIP